METFLVGFSLSATGGLAWLAYNRPEFAAKLLLGLLICSVLIQIGLQCYQCGYRAGQSTIATVRSSASGIDSTIEKYSFYLNIAAAILLGLMLFAILIGNNKKTPMPEF
jgi:NADH:ubiquinone oxidoreductase subunit 6 (subunit J)